MEREKERRKSIKELIKKRREKENDTKSKK